MSSLSSTDPQFAILHSDPRWKELLGRMNLAGGLETPSVPCSGGCASRGRFIEPPLQDFWDRKPLIEPPTTSLQKLTLDSQLKRSRAAGAENLCETRPGLANPAGFAMLPSC